MTIFDLQLHPQIYASLHYYKKVSFNHHLSKIDSSCYNNWFAILIPSAIIKTSNRIL